MTQEDSKETYREIMADIRGGSARAQAVWWRRLSQYAAPSDAQAAAAMTAVAEAFAKLDAVTNPA